MVFTRAHSLISRWLVLAFTVSACIGAPDDDDAEANRSAITNGVPESGYMAVFSLAYQGQGGCSGTCITPRVGLTAAHCFWDEDQAEDFTALFGDDEAAPTTTIAVTAFAKVPGSDLAIVAFAEPCPSTIPYNRAPLEGHEDEPVVMVGFGVTTEDADDAGVKRSGTATLFSVDPAEVAGMEPGELATSNVPAGTCNGDSGGPTFMTIDGVEFMIGTTSRGSVSEQGMEYPCGQGYSIAVRADPYSAFIDDFIEAHDPGALDEVDEVDEVDDEQPDRDGGDVTDGDVDTDDDARGDGDGDDDGVDRALDDGDGEVIDGGCACVAGGSRAQLGPATALLLVGAPSSQPRAYP